MGDGIFDLVIRGKASEAAEIEHVFTRVRNAEDQTWKIHRNSISRIQLWLTIRRLQHEHLLSVSEHDGWLHIKEPYT